MKQKTKPDFTILFLAIVLIVILASSCTIINNPPAETSCPYEFGECPNEGCSNNPALLRDYQLYLHMDTVKIYDGYRLVGSYISTWNNQMDSIILNDNQ